MGSNTDSRRLSYLYSYLEEAFYNNNLCPLYWHKSKFDEEVREKLLTIAKDFYDHLQLDVPLLDVQLTGSLANYNYNDQSDLDVHIIIDFTDINENVELVKKALDGVRFIWNIRHDIVIKKHDVELYVQDVNEQHTSSGLYSLLNDEWIKKPTYNPPSIDVRDVNEKYRLYIDEINRIADHLNSGELSNEEYANIQKRADKLKSKIQNDRKEGLKKDGEFSVENLVFKKLRNSNDIEKLIDIGNQAYDRIFSDKH